MKIVGRNLVRYLMNMLHWDSEENIIEVFASTGVEKIIINDIVIFCPIQFNKKRKSKESVDKHTVFLKLNKLFKKKIMIKNYRVKDIMRYWMTWKKHLSKKRYSIVSSSYQKIFLHLSVCFSKKIWIHRRFPYVLHTVLLFSNLWSRSSDKIK